MKIGWLDKKDKGEPAMENAVVTEKQNRFDTKKLFSKTNEKLSSLFSEKEPEPIKEDTEVADLSGYVMKEVSEAKDQYWLNKPFAYATIIEVPGDGPIYEITEPIITLLEQALMRQVIYILRDTLLFDAEKNPVRKDAFTDGQIRFILKSQDPNLSPDRAEVLVYYIRRDLSGYGPVDPLMHDEALEDISCNGGELPVYVFHQKYGSMPTSIIFEDQALNEFVLKLAQKADKSVSLTVPMIDATLPEGARAQIKVNGKCSAKCSSG